MNLIKPVLSTVLLSAFLFGCGKNEAVTAAEAMATDICACKDMACAQKASTEHTKKIMEFKDKKGTKADVEAIKAAGEKAQGCMKKIVADSLKKAG